MTVLRDISAFTPPPYLLEPLANSLLKPPKKRPSTRSMPRVSASLGAWWSFSSMAARAGDSVSELMAEITVEMAMVSANCL